MVLWYGNKLCDAGFLINLANRTDRLERSLLELNNSKIEGVVRFDACIISDPNYIKYGCTKSHIEIAKLQIENKWDYVLYLEDDIVSDFFYEYNTDNLKINKKEVSEQIIKSLNNYKPDILWLGVRPETYTEKFSDCLIKPNITLMSHAYLGSLKYAEFLVENLLYDNSNHFSHRWTIDFFISQINMKNDWTLNNNENGENFKKNDLVIVASSPMIFNQGRSYSDLLDREVNYSEWVRGCFSEYVNPEKLGIKKFLYE